MIAVSSLSCKAQAPAHSTPAPAPKAQPVLEPRQFPAVAHDAVHRQFLLFGGTYGSQRFNDTWLLGASGWTSESSQASPAARISAAAAYDSVHNEYILFGGRVKLAQPASCSPGAAPKHLKTEFFCGDTWVFKGQNWVRVTTAVSPSAREGHAMVFDAAHSEVVLFGGTAAGSSTPLNDTWLWNGTTWRQVYPVHNPAARLWHSMGYDPVHRNVVLFGGDGGSQFLNDTWIWNGLDWQPTRPAPAGPASRTNAGLDYDPVTGSMVLFSGTTWNSRRNGSPALDSWSWNGSQWKQLPSAKFQLISDFSKLTPAQAAASTLANGTPSVLWLPVK